MQSGEEGTRTLHPLCFFAVTLLYLVAMLSVPTDALGMLLWFALYPIIMAAAVGVAFSRIFLLSLTALPFALLIGLFNPIYDRQTALSVYGLNISQGWISYISIIVRTLLSVQALLLLIRQTGFVGLCRSLRSIGMPSFLCTQLLMVYRYLSVLLEESLNMTRARRARGYAKRHFSLTIWGAFCGQLFLRTVDRAEKIHRAMLARGFNGSLPRFSNETRKWGWPDTLTLLGCTAAFAVLRFLNLSLFFS